MVSTLPALASSREEARSAICTTHLDQIFKATFMYAQAHDERLPHFGGQGTRGEGSNDRTYLRPWWPTQLSDRLNGETDVYVYPSDVDPYQGQFVVRRGDTLVISSGIEPGRFPIDVTYRGSCDSVYSAAGDMYLARRITDWDNPSKAVILIEARKRHHDNYGDPDCFRFNPDLMEVGTEEWYKNPLAHTWERHSGTSNCLFIDGSIGRRNPREVPDIVVKQEYWDSGRDKWTAPRR